MIAYYDGFEVETNKPVGVLLYPKSIIFDDGKQKKLLPLSAFIGAIHKRMDVYE
jgi:hypothetical protein